MFDAYLTAIAPPRARIFARLDLAILLHANALASALEAAHAEHAEELEYGRAAFALDAEQPTLTPARFDDLSFVCPFSTSAADNDANLPADARVHATSAPLLTAAECDALVAEASEAMAAGSGSRFTYTADSRLGEVHTSELPAARRWLARALRERVWPLIESRFGAEAGQLAVYDSLIVRYSTARGGVRQPTHRDGALYTVNVALSSPSDYQGGGTWFERTRQVARLARGHALAHSSDARHAGHRLLAGERWVLVIFALSADRPELARRLGEQASAARRDGRAALSRELCLAAMSLAPRDHELHYAIGILRAETGDPRGARAALARAAALYPHCPRPQVALGSLALAADRPVDALRHFERALALVCDEDEGAWWDAAVNRALCAVMLAEAEPAGGAGARDPRGDGLGEDLVRLRTALALAPGDERVTELIGRVERALSLPPRGQTPCDTSALVEGASDCPTAAQL
jgi:tetratricopeptide (TPR) repeat protein